jgi:hypothetical protein
MIPAIGTKTADIQGTEFYWLPTKYLLLESLAQGVPQVAIPVAFDQPKERISRAL